MVGGGSRRRGRAAGCNRRREGASSRVQGPNCDTTRLRCAKLLLHRGNTGGSHLAVVESGAGSAVGGIGGSAAMAISCHRGGGNTATAPGSRLSAWGDGNRSPHSRRRRGHDP